MNKFDTFLESVMTLILDAKKCNGPSLRQLSDKRAYRWCRCAENPYSPGYKKVYYGRKGKRINVAKCLQKFPTSGTAKYYDCMDAVAALRRRIAKRKAAQQ
jgi:hypothetical protein